VKARTRKAAASAGVALAVALPVGVSATGGLGEPDPGTTEPGTTTDPSLPPPPPVDYKQLYLEERRRSARRLRGWRKAARRARRLRLALWASPDPVRLGLICIHGGEGSWDDVGDPYWGGLQMDRRFQLTYGRPLVEHFGWAHRWPAAAQLAVGEVAFYAGRGFGPWPKTRKACGL
jgi:hypothetical protein